MPQTIKLEIKFQNLKHEYLFIYFILFQRKMNENALLYLQSIH